MRIGAPVARPSTVVCVGMNYAAHAAETGNPPPGEPVFFFKHPNTVVGPQDALIRPHNSDKLDWEVELAVIIGRRADRLESPEVAAQHVAGYAVANDVSARLEAGIWWPGQFRVPIHAGEDLAEDRH